MPCVVRGLTMKFYYEADQLSYPPCDHSFVVCHELGIGPELLIHPPVTLFKHSLLLIK